MIRPTRRGFLLGSVGIAADACRAGGLRFAGTLHDPLRRGFLNPPNAARPRVYWHWMDGHVTARAAREDIAWMQRVGLGGVLNVDWDSSPFSLFPGVKPAVGVDETVSVFGERWRSLIRNSVDWASQSDLEFDIMSSPGTSLTGGPWVKPEQAMKKYVWSETYIRQGQKFTGELERPPCVTGPFQDLPLLETTLDRGFTRPEYYVDAAVVAYRVTKSELEDLTRRPTLSSSHGVLDADTLGEGASRNEIEIPYDGGSTWILASYAVPVEVRTVQICAHPLPKYLEASVDGTQYARVCEFKPGCAQQTVSIPAVRARYFRYVFERPTQGMPFLAPSKGQRVSLLRLLKTARVHRFEDKAGFPQSSGFGTVTLDRTDETPNTDPDQAIPLEDITDLSDRLDADGNLRWTPPPGDWVVLRFGYSLLGRSNHGATPAGHGLEVDKLDRRHVAAYLEEYLKEYESALGGPLAQRGVKSVWLDSFEQGPQNGTEQLLQAFRARRGYDPMRWLPVLAGRIVGSSQQSDSWLCDFRSTLSELFVDEHYREIADQLHRRGMSVYGQAHEHGRWFVGDGMDVRHVVDIPTGAMWTSVGERGAAVQDGYDVDLREAASVANVHGQKLVGVEAFGALGNAYGFAPEDFKLTADRIFCAGANRLMIAASPHQPDERPGPGVSSGPFGCWFTRKETWAEQARPWIDYLARCAYLLQQGRRVADIAYLYGEENNLTGLLQRLPDTLPKGHGFDFVNANALLTVLQAKDGRLLARSGNSYRLLVLDASTESMSLALLRRIEHCVDAGVQVIGALPRRRRGLTGELTEFTAICARLRGRVRDEPVTAQGILDALKRLSLEPSMRVEQALVDADIQFVHRHWDEADIFFVSNRDVQPRDVTLSFRIAGKAPEIWHPDSGDIETASYEVGPERVSVQLALEPRGSAFVVFKSREKLRSRGLRKPKNTSLMTLRGGWEVSFKAQGRAERSIRLDDLVSWPDVEDPEIKYFSGTACYRHHFQLAYPASNSRIFLNLGRVKNVAEVRVNGQSAGIAWKAPFIIEISRFVKNGDNTLEVLVTNLWPNRLIGNEVLAEGQAPEWTNYNPYTRDSMLLPSGLLGPVEIVARAQ